jgi:hypothetical protein
MLAHHKWKNLPVHDQLMAIGKNQSVSTLAPLTAKHMLTDVIMLIDVIEHGKKLSSDSQGAMNPH